MQREVFSGLVSSAMILCHRSALWLLLCGGLLPSCASGGADLDLQPRQTRLEVGEPVPFRLERNVPLVTAWVDNAGPMRFLLDTGAETTVVDRGWVGRQGIAPDGPPLVILGADGELVEDVPTFRIEELRLAHCRFLDFDACVMDLEPFGAALGVSLDGILGVGLFRDMGLTVDYPRREVRLDSGGLLRGAEESVELGRRGELPTLPVRIGDVVLSAVVDTGSAETLAVPLAWEDRLAYEVEPTWGHLGTSVGGTSRQSLMARLSDDAEVGAFVIRRPLIYLTEGPPRLGGGFLRQFVVELDFVTWRARLTEAEPRDLTLRHRR